MRVPSIQEMQLIADLRDNAGYRLILENIQAFVDDLAMQLEDAPDDAQDRRRLTLWRAARKILAILQFTPEQFTQEMQAELARMSEGQRAALELQRPTDFMSRAKFAGPPPMGPPVYR